MKNTLIYAIFITLIPVSTLFGQTIQPDDFEYRGAFRLPEGSNGTDWGYSGTP